MKKTLMFIGLLALSAGMAYSQTFGAAGSYWTYCSVGWPSGTSSPSHLEQTGSYTVSGKEIKVITGPAFNAFNRSSVHVYVNGDSTYVYTPYDSSFTLLYNFSFQVGDTMHLNFRNAIFAHSFSPPLSDSASAYMRFRVDSVGTRVIQSTTLRTYRMVGEYSGMSQSQFPVNVQAQQFVVTELLGTDVVLPVIYSGTWDGARPELNRYENTAHPGFYGPLRECVLSVDEYSLWGGSLYPNPVSEELFVNSAAGSDAKAHITDLQGRTVKSGIVLRGGQSTQVSTTDLKPGLYVLNVTGSGGNKTQQKFLKQ